MTQISPSPRFPERDRQQAYDEIIAQPKRNALGERSGERYAEEGLGFVPSVAGAFFNGVSSADSGASHHDVEVQIAGQAGGRTRLGGQNPPPTWDGAERQDLAAFAGAQGVAFGELDPGRRPYTGTSREMNPNTITPLHGLDRGEPTRATYGRKIAPANGGRRRNQADVSDL